MDNSKPGFSRRSFLGNVIAGAGALGGAGCGTGASPAAAPAPSQADKTSTSQGYTFTEGSAALQADRVVKSACQFCNSLCGLNVHMKHGRIIHVAGEPNDPVQAGELCVKASLMTQLVYNRRRIKTPLKRVGAPKGSSDSKFEAISWDEALDTIGRKFLQLRDAGEAHTIANRTSGRMPRGAGSVIHRFFTLLGSPNDTDVGPVCNDAGGNALAWTFGLGNFTNGYGVDAATGQEDLGSAKCFLFFGTNQAETHPVTFAHLLRSRARTGARLIVVDPRRTPTAVHADRWIAPKPHTDLALALAMLSHVISAGLYDRGFVEQWVLGFDELKRHLADRGYTPEWAAAATDIPAATIRTIAEEYARAKPAAIFCNAGISHQLNAFDTYRALAFLAAITGNIGVPGGGCNFMHNTWPGGLHLPDLTVAPAVSSQPALPVGPDSFAESILAGRPYRLRAVVTAGNPMISSANTERVMQAYRALEFYVYTGLFLEEAAYYADIVLPVTSGLEMATVYMRRDDRAIRWQEAAVPPVGESKPDQNIWIELAHRMDTLDRANPHRWAAQFPREWLDYRNLWKEFVARTPAMGGMSMERMSKRAEPLRWPCPNDAHPGVSTLYLDHPTWQQAVEALDPSAKGKRFLTPSGKVEIHTDAINQKLAVAGHASLPIYYTHSEVTGQQPTIRYSSTLVANPVNPGALTPKVEIGVPSTDAVHQQFPLMGMTGRPSVVHFATITHWTYTGQQENGERLVQINPAAARKAGIANGDAVRVESPRGSVEGTALFWDGIREDTIFIPNTFGPAQEVSDEFGLPRYRAVNALLDDRYFDNLSGQQAYKCFACRVVKA